MRKTPGLWKIKLALYFSGRKWLKALDLASKDIKKAQYDVLFDILDWAKNTEYGKKYNFASIRTIDDFRKNLPLNDYEDMQPYIMRHTRGEENVLFPGKPMLYATTSGRNKEPKWIPITKKYYDECYNGLSRLWLYSLLKEHPHVFDGPSVTIARKSHDGYTEDGTSYGSFSGQTRANIPKFLRHLHAIPAEVYNIPNYYSRYYVIMRISLEKSIRMIVSGNPGALLEMHNTVRNHYSELLEDIETGTLNKKIDIPSHIRKTVEKNLRPNPKRARELRQLKSKFKVVQPKHYWPKLQVIVTWMAGNSGLYLRRAKMLYPQEAAFREFGYFTTEARAGIVLKSNTFPCILAAHLIFFEFIKEADMGKVDCPTFLAHELEIGERYFVLVTTSSGLYRYKLNDILRIEGYYNQFPMVRFIQTKFGITNLCGERLHERHFLEAMEEVQDEMRVQAPFYLAFADPDTSAYHLYIEFKQELSLNQRGLLAKLVDHKLGQMNLEYLAKRESGELNPLIVKSLEKNAFSCFKTACVEQGYHDGHFKLNHLMLDPKRQLMFEELVKK